MVALQDRTPRRLTYFVAQSALGLGAVALAVALAAAAILLLMRHALPALEELDRDAAATLDRVLDRRSAATVTFTAATTLGGNAVMWWLATVTAAGMVLRRQLRLAAFLVVTGLGALALAPLVKVLAGWLAADRPVDGVPISATSPHNAFPSGHAINAVVFYGALLLVFLPVIPKRRRGLAIGLLAALVTAIGFSRSALGVQKASDIVGGWIVGLAWLAVTTYAFRRWRRAIGGEPRPLWDGLEPEAASVLAPGRTVHMRHPGRVAATVLLTAAVLAVVFIGLGVLVSWWAPGFDDATPRWLAAHHTAGLDRVSTALSWAGNPRAIISIGLVIGPLAVGCVHRWRPAAFLAVLMLGEFALVLTIAALVQRPASIVESGDDLPGSTFPAGPSAATLCLFGALAVILVPRTRPHGWLRWLTVTVVIAVPTGVALSGLYRGAYRPLDVVGAALFAAAWLAAVTRAIDPNVDLHTPPAPDPVVRRDPLPTAVAAPRSRP
jgi:undecaprenyl-diphosphatase